MNWLDAIGGRLRARMVAIGPAARERLVVAVGLLVAILPRLPQLDQTLTETYSFRQTQTAYTALVFHQQGIDLFASRMPALGPPFQVPYEFPLFQAFASLVMDIGVPPDLALRASNLFFFVCTAVLLWLLVRRLAGSTAALFAFGCFLVSPFGLVWSRTSMIEYLATASAVGFALVAMAWRDRPTVRTWLAAVVLGSVAMTVKITTGGFWILPVLAYAVRPARPAPQRDHVRFLLGLGALIGIPVLAGLAWTAWADHIKSLSPFTAWLTSAALTEWNYGTLAQRQDLGNWAIVGRRIAGELVGVPLLPLVAFAFAALRRTRLRLVWVAIMVIAVLPIAVLFNLYVVHDYYLIAVSPAVAAVLGLGASWAWEHRPRRRSPVSAVVFGVLAIAAVVLTFRLVTSYWQTAYEPAHEGGVLGLADEIDRVSAPSDRVVVEGLDWMPAVLYYARREGLALPSRFSDSPLLGGLAADGYRYLAMWNPDHDPIASFAGWPWIGVVSDRVYVLGTSPADVPGAHVMSGQGPNLPALPADAAALTDAPFEVRCDRAPIVVPTGPDGTWIQLSGADPTQVRVAIGGVRAPVPARPLITLDTVAGTGGAGTTIACNGADSITIDGIWAAAPPH